MSEMLKKLLEKVESDANLHEQFKACKNVEEQSALAKELGFEVSAEEFIEASKLSDDQLDQVAGGCTLYVQCVF